MQPHYLMLSLFSETLSCQGEILCVCACVFVCAGACVFMSMCVYASECVGWLGGRGEIRAVREVQGIELSAQSASLSLICFMSRLNKNTAVGICTSLPCQWTFFSRITRQAILA